MYLNNLTSQTINQNIVSISFFKYKGRNIFWALKEMQFAKKPLSETPGLNFYKLMGSGSGEGFGLKPDFNIYALVAVWKNRNYAKNFFRTSKVFRGFKERSKDWWTLFMTTLNSKGKWDKHNPFLPQTLSLLQPSDHEYEGPIAVFTRATISPRHLISFWKSVPGGTEILKEQKGLIYSKGLGEYSFFHQATFSLWESKKAFFTHQSEKHKNVIDKTKDNGWYNEGLFAEFKIIESEGNWQGIKLVLANEIKRNGETVLELIKQRLSENAEN